jgi:hypothetical protein
VPNRVSEFCNNSLGVAEMVDLFFPALEKQRALSAKLRKTQRQLLENDTVRGLSSGIELARFTKYESRTGGLYG